MYSSRMREQFMGDDPLVKPRWSGFCVCSMNGCILILIIHSSSLDIVGVTVIPL